MNGNIMYRSERYSGSGVCDVKEVMKFEICTLGNTDILDYCLENYNFTPAFKKSLFKLRNFIEKNNIIDEIGDITKVRYAHHIIEQLIDEISINVGHPIRYAVWLADLDTVREIYSVSDSDEDIEAYETSDVVLSDLGEDGKLFGYETYPLHRNLSIIINNLFY